MIALFTTLATSGALKWILAALAGAVALIAAWFHGNTSGATRATEAAQSKVDAAQATATAAKTEAAAQAEEAAAARQAANAAQTATQARAKADATPDDQLDAELASLGALRKD